MITAYGISGNPPLQEILDFDALRKRGLHYIQELSGDVWTDFNTHDPGVTLLEILCYSLTDLGYRTEQIKDAFFSDIPIAKSYIEKYLFEAKELLPSLPVTIDDIENYIQLNIEDVTAAWVTPFPIMHSSEAIRGGYEVSVFLNDKPGYDDLNSDVVEIKVVDKNLRIQCMLFDKENRRFPWGKIDKIRRCSLATDEENTFFSFEKYNGQLLLDLEAKFLARKTYETIPIKARITINGIDNPLGKNTSISQFKELLLEITETEVFLAALHKSLKKEKYKETILNKIRKTLLPVRNLCEDFIRFNVVNVQEIKMNIQLLLNEDAPNDTEIMQQLFNRMDAFMLSLVKKRKASKNTQEKNILYASHIIEELGTIAGVKAVQIGNLNLFVDGIPTISLQEEGSFDCLHLQNFARYAPKVSREKSEITLVRYGVKQTFRLSEVTTPFTSKSVGNFSFDTAKDKHIVKEELNETFFENIRSYFSIQEEFPENYRLSSGQPSRKAPKHVFAQQKRFKSYLLFYDRLLMQYTERLFQLSSQLSFKQNETLDTMAINDLMHAQLPDIKAFDLVQDLEAISSNKSVEEIQQELYRKNQVLDHLLARFGVVYEHLESKSGNLKERHLNAKMRLLRDAPRITKERALGLPLIPSTVTDVWKDTMLSGFQRKMYRLLGVEEEVLEHKKLSATTGKTGQGFYMIEHFLLMNRAENHVYEKKLNHASHLLIDYLKDLFLGTNSSFNHSFEVSILIPNWYGEWKLSKDAYEEIIRKELPGHIVPRIHWITKKSIRGFEILYEDWLKALYETYK